MAVRLDGLRVLVLDDDGDLAEAVATMLCYHGASPMTAANVGDALSRTADVSFDVIVVDIGLPREDGFAFLEQLRQQERTTGGEAAARVIALTGYAMAADRTRTAAAGFELHLAKPIDQEELVLAVRMAADGNAAAFAAARRDIA